MVVLMYKFVTKRMLSSLAGGKHKRMSQINSDPTTFLFEEYFLRMSCEDNFTWFNVHRKFNKAGDLVQVVVRNKEANKNDLENLTYSL